MKYVWASWGNPSGRFSGERMKGIQTKHIKGYGCAVSITCAEDVVWSPVDMTYALGAKGFETSIAKV